jgi:hypothetical protein
VGPEELPFIVLRTPAEYFLNKVQKLFKIVGFEVFTAVTENAVFWDVASPGFVINQRFGGKCHHNLQRRFISK